MANMYSKMKKAKTFQEDTFILKVRENREKH